MNALAAALDSPFAAALGATLVHFLWQGAAVSVGLAAVLVLLRRARPEVRYAACVAALAALLVAPAATFVRLRAVEASGTHGRGRILTDAQRRPPERTVAEGRAPASPDRWGADPERVPAPTAGPSAAEPPRPAVAASGPSARAISKPPASWRLLVAATRWAPAGWGLGVLLSTVAYAGGWLRARRWRRSRVTAAPLAWSRRMVELAGDLGVRRPVELLASSSLRTPILVGWWRPAIVVPLAAFGGLSPEHLEAILAHELAHVRRHDALVNLFQVAAEILFFYHPGVWWVSGALRAEREHCCDELAVRGTGTSRLTLARALLETAELGLGRSVGASAAVLAATGGSLSERVRRLLGRRPRRAAGERAGLFGALSGLAVLVCAFLTGLPRESTAAMEVDPGRVRAPGGWFELAAGDGGGSARPVLAGGREAETSATPVMASEPGEAWRRGTWLAERHGGRVELDMSLGTPRSRSRWSDTFTAGELGLGTGTGPVTFALVRDAGTFRFEGELGADGTGRGALRFEPDLDYARRLQAMGYQVEDDGRLLQLAIHDVSETFLREMDGLGYGEEGLDRMVEFRIHGVDGDYVRALAAAGYEGLSAARLVEGRIHGVSPTWLTGMRDAGLAPADMAQAVEMRIHGVEADLVRELRQEGYDPTAEEVIALRIHGVTPDGIRALEAAGLGRLSLERAVELGIHGVDGPWLRSLEAAGVHDLDATTARDLKIHGVDAAWVEALARAGYPDLPARRLEEMKIHGIDAGWIEELDRAGVGRLSPDRLVAYRIHGVDSAWIEELRDAGATGLTEGALLDLRIHGVTGDFVRRVRETGDPDLDADHLLELKIHGLDRWIVGRHHGH
ncbi:MAG: M56 family metallopeptidase [Thermoanaerobaculia bacterium]